MTDQPRLIEHAFPLKQASLDSVHEKNVRHGHISTLHIWPARRPLAACRAALIATFLPDPGTPEERQALCEKIGGKVVKRVEKKKMPGGATVEREKEQTEGGILHWGRETENAETLDWFREEIRKAYGGRAPKVLDPVAGGGAIPLEAMRLGCEATAIDINPVAWFILKCTLEYPQKLAGQKRPLPPFILKDREFMEAFFKAQGLSKAHVRRAMERLGHADEAPTLPGLDLEGATLDADLAWHVRTWGKWVLAHARKELARFYPVYADFEPLDPGMKSYERQPMRLVPLKDDGTPDMATLNGDFSDDYLAVKGNPRWVAKPTVAYLWARTVTCKNCRATVPLLKTRWLCKKDRKRVLLTMEPNRDKTGMVFGVDTDVAVKGSNAAQRREHDKRLGAGTMTGAGAKCPCCGTIMTWEDLRIEGQAQHFGRALLATVIDGVSGKEYRLPREPEALLVAETEVLGIELFKTLPFGLPLEPTPEPFGPRRHGAALRRYGMTRWADMFTARQLFALGSFVCLTRTAGAEMQLEGYPLIWKEAVISCLALAIDRIADRGSTGCHWDMGYEKVANTFTGFRFSMSWDFTEANVIGRSTGSYSGQLEWIAQVIEHATLASNVSGHTLGTSDGVGW